MKNILLLILIFLTALSYSQDFKIPDIKFENELDSTNRYVKQLNLKDQDALILIIGIDNDSSEKGFLNFIIYNNDGSVLKFQITEKHSNRKQKIIPVSVNKRNYKEYWDYLNNAIAQKKFDFESEAFNTKNGVSKLTFEITRNKRYTQYYNLREKELFGSNEGLNDQQKRLLALVREISKLFDQL